MFGHHRIIALFFDTILGIAQMNCLSDLDTQHLPLVLE